MIEIKIKLDNQMLIAPEPSLAPLYYKAGNLYRAREYRKEAIDCYQTILENFSDTALAPKATKALKDMGVKSSNPNKRSPKRAKPPDRRLMSHRAIYKITPENPCVIKMCAITCFQARRSFNGCYK